MAETKVQPLNITSYHSKLVGVTFEGRQDIIGTLAGDETIRFRREPDNEYDKNAVAVDVLREGVVIHDDEGNTGEVSEWIPIGYIARDKNAELAKVLSNGKYASIELKEITGGDDKAFGVNVYIEYEKERRTTRSANARLEKDFFGNEIFYDPELHEYTNALGEIYLSGSAYAHDDDFDAEHWAEYAVTTYGLNEDAKQKIKDMWECNGHASRSFGTALHAAIELYGTYHELADIIDQDLKTGTRKKLSAKVEKNSALSKLPYLKKVALKFFTPERLEETAFYEVLVVDHKNKRAGRIDRLVMTEEGHYKVRDIKTNSKVTAQDKRDHTKQLSFYGDLILANGAILTEDAIGLHHWTENKKGEEIWEDIPLKKIDTLDTLPTKSLSRQ